MVLFGSPENKIKNKSVPFFEHYENLKTFPFKTEQKCWEPEFWHSMFTDNIKNGEHDEVMAAIDEFVKARDAAVA